AVVIDATFFLGGLDRLERVGVLLRRQIFLRLLQVGVFLRERHRGGAENCQRENSHHMPPSKNDAGPVTGPSSGSASHAAAGTPIRSSDDRLPPTARPDSGAQRQNRCCPTERAHGTPGFGVFRYGRVVSNCDSS